jgi:hypothetical protein
VKQDPGLWKLAPPETPAPVETAGLNKDEADFVSRYLALADELLKPQAAEHSNTKENPSPDDKAA